MASIKKLCGFEKIEVGDFFRESTWKKGYDLHNAGHVDKIYEVVVSNSSSSNIGAKCLPETSVRNKPYDINIKITDGRTIEEAQCTCISGVSGQCKHTAAVVVAVNEWKDDSCTSGSRQWGITKRVEHYGKGVIIKNMFPLAPPTELKLSIPSSFVNYHFPDLNCSLVHMLKAEEKTQEEREISDRLNEMVQKIHDEEQSKFIDEIIMNSFNISNFMGTMEVEEIEPLKIKIKYINPILELDQNQRQFYNNNIFLPSLDTKSIAIQTIKQSSSEQWHIIRKNRISTTKCHKIKTRRENNNNLASKLINSNFKGNVATRYGNKLESAARKKYMYLTKNNVIETGVIICAKFPWLCTSPDGIIKLENGEWKLLEIKCPYKRKNQIIVDQISKISFIEYLEFVNGNIELKKSSLYYTQVQVSMFVLNLDYCDFVVYSSKDIIICEGMIF